MVYEFCPSVLLLVYMCDIYVMLSFLVALTVAVLLCALYRRPEIFMGIRSHFLQLLYQIL